MALLWLARNHDAGRGPRPELVELTDAAVALGAGSAAQGAEAQIIPFDSPHRFALVAGDPARFRINGQPLRAGIRVVRDRDEISIAREVIAYFAAHSPPRVAEFHEAEHGRLECPVCTRPIAGPAVRCPRCSRWFCQSEDFPCWSSGPTCPSGDGQLTDLEAGPDWVPEIFREEDEA